MGCVEDSKELAKFLFLDIFGHKMKASVESAKAEDENVLVFELDDGSVSNRAFKTEANTANVVPPSKVKCDHFET